ncbi:hypothetical protein P4B35_19865 [Pontiellaceae bacterium B12227]|nr:hypothetical protein [Pontiellaceae bacterium B12227]
MKPTAFAVGSQAVIGNKDAASNRTDSQSLEDFPALEKLETLQRGT